MRRGDISILLVSDQCTRIANTRYDKSTREIAGIIIFAVGEKFAIRGVGEPLSDGARLALCGGVALYLAGHVAFRARMGGGVSYSRLAAIGALAVLFVAGTELAAWGLAGLVTVVLVALCALETMRERGEATPLSP